MLTHSWKAAFQITFHFKFYYIPLLFITNTSVDGIIISINQNYFINKSKKQTKSHNGIGFIGEDIETLLRN